MCPCVVVFTQVRKSQSIHGRPRHIFLVDEKLVITSQNLSAGFEPLTSSMFLVDGGK